MPTSISRAGAATVYEPPTKDQGARRVWSDSKGRLWISEWNSGNVSVYDPAAKSWKQWKLPGEKPRTYAVWVDPDDKVWLTDWTANAVVRFDPETEKFESFPSDRPNSNVRQLLGRKGEAWIAESGTERIRVIRYPVEDELTRSAGTRRSADSCALALVSPAARRRRSHAARATQRVASVSSSAAMPATPSIPTTRRSCKGLTCSKSLAGPPARSPGFDYSDAMREKARSRIGMGCRNPRSLHRRSRRAWCLARA